jgi:hypothetical protein
MQATDFEYRHQTLLHLLLVGLAVSAYFLNPDDIVWALVRVGRPGPAQGLPIRCCSPFALVLGLLVPLAGTIVIIGGEARPAIPFGEAFGGPPRSGDLRRA